MWLGIYLLGCVIVILSAFIHQKHEYKYNSDYELTLREVLIFLLLSLWSWATVTILVIHFSKKIVFIDKKGDNAVK